MLTVEIARLKGERVRVKVARAQDRVEAEREEGRGIVSRLRVRLASIAALVLLFGYLAIANFVPEETRLASPCCPTQGMRLGLDLQGGIHWVLGVKLEIAEKHELEFLADSVESLAEEEDFALEKVAVENGRLLVTTLAKAEVQQVRQWADDHGGLSVVSEAGNRLELALAGSWRDEVRERGMRQVLEVLRRRIDDPVTGIPDSVVTRQGDDRILVQIPGGEIERERAGELLKVTGFLEFKIVIDSAQTEELLRANHPEGLPEDSVDRLRGGPGEPIACSAPIWCPRRPT